MTVVSSTPKSIETSPTTTVLVSAAAADVTSEKLIIKVSSIAKYLRIVFIVLPPLIFSKVVKSIIHKAGNGDSIVRIIPYRKCIGPSEIDPDRLVNAPVASSHRVK